MTNLLGFQLNVSYIDNNGVLGYTQQKLSEIAGINKTTISEIENGRFTGVFDIFERLLDAVNLQFDVSQKKYSLPDWDEIENIFSEDE